MVEAHNQRPSEWRRLFAIACDLLDQVRDQTGGYPFQWSFGGGTAMMIRIGHRESHDIDILLDDSQIWGFLDPAKPTCASGRFLHPTAETVRGFRNSPLRRLARSISSLGC
ncbi:nucleotidyl transferase AbiEii/AbiGii toxin family protein [Shinella sp. S4-D37]|uniref:nucleotidyl transferase AbiEii/AbiGii toxin family protein n=1 Tax=Shinella sp. S4-D37 TaxID=3161999 RepID=UPI0034671AF5